MIDPAYCNQKWYKVVMVKKSEKVDEILFQIGDTVVYPSHGVGQITAEEVQIIAGCEMTLYVISFMKDKMILRVPKNRAIKAGLRHLTSSADFEEAISVLKQKAKMTKGMWSKRAQEYEQKINSGSIKSIAEVLRDLHKNVGDADRSYSERVIYEAALERLSNEYAASVGLEKDEAYAKLVEMLDVHAAM